MNHYSQTILSLYSELLAGGCEDSELLAVRRAYDLQCELFRGRHTGSGKTHISHGVGTASVLLSVGAPLRLLPAALVHNAYGLGDFGDDAGAVVTGGRRDRMRKSLDEHAESCVARFYELGWSIKHVEEYLRDLDKLDALTLDTILIKIADELEHSLDGGFLFRGNDFLLKNSRARRAYIPELASRIGYPQFIERFEETYALLDDRAIPEFLRQTPN